MKKTTKMWITFFLLIGGSYALYYYNHHHYSAADIDRELKKAARGINVMCPIQGDENTRLDNVEIPAAGTIQYNMTLVNAVKADVDTTKLRAEIEPEVILKQKTNPQAQDLRDREVVMISTYRDKNGEFLFKIVVTPEDYN